MKLRKFVFVEGIAIQCAHSNRHKPVSAQKPCAVPFCVATLNHTTLPWLLKLYTQESLKENFRGRKMKEPNQEIFWPRDEISQPRDVFQGCLDMEMRQSREQTTTLEIEGTYIILYRYPWGKYRNIFNIFNSCPNLEIHRVYFYRKPPDNSEHRRDVRQEQRKVEISGLESSNVK